MVFLVRQDLKGADMDELLARAMADPTAMDPAHIFKKYALGHMYPPPHMTQRRTRHTFSKSTLYGHMYPPPHLTQRRTRHTFQKVRSIVTVCSKCARTLTLENS